MANLAGLYKNFIIFLLLLAAFTLPPGLCYAEDTPIQAAESSYLDDIEEETEADFKESNYDSSTAYINDIEILGSNIIKPEYILSKMSLQKGDLYDKEIICSKI